MPNITIHKTSEDVPLPLYYQAETFIRLTWADDEDYDMDDGLDEPAVHITLSEGNTLFSYASLISTDLALAGVTYRCYGLRSVFTFPASRKQGYGRQVVQAAGDYVSQQADADVALLWTEAHNIAFYERLGWVTMTTMKTLFGEPDSPEVFDEETAMMLFISDKGRAGKAVFDTGQVYVGDEPW
ncbi:MAG: GNAT family N-acetyltransferase [Chloroflexota bacterium]